MEIDEIINSPNWKAVGAILSVIAAGVAIIPKIVSVFSDYRNKSRLRRDLDLFKLSEGSSIDATLIKDRIDAQIVELYRRKKRVLPSFTDFLGGIAFSGGFAFWTYDIYSTNQAFNPWMILTTLFSIVGLTIIFEPRKSKTSVTKKRIPVFALYVFSWLNTVINLTVAICSFWYAVNLFFKVGFSGWHILMAVLIFGSIYGVGQQFEIKLKKDFTEEDST